MAQPDLDQAQIDAAFEQMGRPGMAERMHTGRFGQAKLLDGGVEGMLEATRAHRCGSAGALAARWPAGRKQPDRVPVRDPMGAEHDERTGRQGHVPILIALASLDVELHTSTVDLGDLELDTFQEPQATGVDGA
jgi:hypothetical protein